MRVGIVGAYKLGIEDGYCRRQDLVLHMMVTHNEVDAQLFGISNLIHSLYAAVEHNHQFDTCLLGIVHSLDRYSIAVVVAVGDVVVYVCGKLLQKTIN